MSIGADHDSEMQGLLRYSARSSSKLSGRQARSTEDLDAHD